jgi:hypothetical protein
MTNTIHETLDDGTPITDELADKLVADVYTALERGAYKVIPNPHGKPEPRKLTNPATRAELKAIVEEEKGA